MRTGFAATTRIHWMLFVVQQESHEYSLFETGPDVTRPLKRIDGEKSRSMSSNIFVG